MLGRVATTLTRASRGVSTPSRKWDERTVSLLRARFPEECEDVDDAHEALIEDLLALR